MTKHIDFRKQGKCEALHMKIQELGLSIAMCTFSKMNKFMIYNLVLTNEILLCFMLNKLIFYHLKPGAM